jgi:hypothetical protein
MPGSVDRLDGVGAALRQTRVTAKPDPTVLT